MKENLHNSTMPFSSKCLLVTLVFIAHLNLSYGQISSDKLFGSFKQGDRTNCASIALIKAALNVYGLDNLFETNKVDDNTYKIRLKNGVNFNLTKEEIKKSRLSADFKIIKEDTDENRKIIEYAVLSYAVMAKCKEIIEKSEGFDIALEQLENGADSKTVYKYLGFEKGKHVQHLRRLSGTNDCGIVAWSPYHAVFACEGYMDYHGNKKALWFKYSGRFRVINNL